MRQRNQNNGIVFRITKNDLHAYFGHWGGDPNIGLDGASIPGDQKEITSLKLFGEQYRKVLLLEWVS